MEIHASSANLLAGDPLRSGLLVDPKHRLRSCCLISSSVAEAKATRQRGVDSVLLKLGTSMALLERACPHACPFGCTCWLVLCVGACDGKGAIADGGCGVPLAALLAMGCGGGRCWYPL